MERGFYTTSDRRAHLCILQIGSFRQAVHRLVQPQAPRCRAHRRRRRAPCRSSLPGCQRNPEHVSGAVQLGLLPNMLGEQQRVRNLARYAPTAQQHAENNEAIHLASSPASGCTRPPPCDPASAPLARTSPGRSPPTPTRRHPISTVTPVPVQLSAWRTLCRPSFLLITAEGTSQ